MKKPMLSIQPWIMLEQLAYGQLSPNRLHHPGTALQTLLQIAPSGVEKCRQNHFAGYQEIMMPVYKALKRTLNQSGAPAQINEPDFEPFISEAAIGMDKQVERYFIPIPGKKPDRDSGSQVFLMYQFITEGEVNRLLHIIDNAITGVKTPGGATETNMAYEFHVLTGYLDYIISLAEPPVYPEPEDITAAIHENLKNELKAVKAETDFRWMVRKGASGQGIGGEANHDLMKTEAWFNHQIKTTLDNWKAKYKRLQAAEQFLKLYLDTEKVQVDENHEHVHFHRQARHHIEIILYLIIIKHIHTDAVKKGVYTYKNAKKQLEEVDQIVLFGGNSEEQSKKIFEWAELLEKAGHSLAVNRVPLVKQRAEQIQNILGHAFASKISAKQIPGQEPDSMIMTAIDRLKRDFITVKQLADYFGIGDDAVRENFKRHGIVPSRFGGQTFITYRQFKEKLDKNSS